MDSRRVDRLAQVLTEYSLELQPGELVTLAGTTLAEPLLLAAYRHALRLGARPVLDVQAPEALEILLKHGSDEQLQTISPLERLAAEEAQASLRVSAAANTRALSGVDPERQKVYSAARLPVRQRFLDRAADGSLKWSSTVFPTQAHAQDADMSLAEYEDFVAAAGFLDDPDPVARWREIAAFQQELIDWLTPRKEIHLIAEDTDLRLSIAGRRWINSDGHRNFPSGEIFTGPVEDSVEGTVRFSFPTIIQGRELHDVRLWFERGRVVRATTSSDQAFLDAVLDTDPGARVLGEFAFGTNMSIQRFTRNILFDEKMGGTVHMALGAGYPDTGSTNRSAIHWDMICDVRQTGEVRVDGQVFLRGGEFITG